MSVETLIHEWNGKLKTMASNTFIVGMDSEDIEQELNIVLWNCMDTHDENKGKFSTYFYTCAHNKIDKLKRYASRQKRTAVLIPLEDCHDVMDYNVYHEDAEFFASIELNKKLSRKQKDEIIKASVTGMPNALIDVEVLKETIGLQSEKGYNISRKKER